MQPQTLETDSISLSGCSEFFDQPGVLALRIDGAGRVVEAGANWSSRLGYADPSLESVHFRDVVTPSSMSQVETILERLRAGEIVAGAIISFQPRQGKACRAIGMFSPVMDGDRMISAHGVFREKGAGSCNPVTIDEPFDPMLLEALVEFAPDGMIITNENQDIIAFNSSFLELWGLDASIVWSGNARAAAVRIIQDRDGFLKSLEELYADPAQSATGVLHLTDNRALDWYSAGTWDEEGKYIGRAWYYRDATARIRVEEEIKRSEALYRQLAANFPDGAVFIYDSRLVFVLADGAGLAGVGLTKEAVEGRMLDDVIPGRLGRTLKPIFVDALDGNQRQQDVRFFDRTFSVTAAPVNFGDAIAGHHAMVIVQDITNRKVLEDRLSGAEARLRALVEQIPAVTYVQHVQDAGNTTVFISPQVESIFGYTATELMDGSVNWLETIHPEDRMMVLASTESANASRPNFVMEYRTVTRGGDTRWVRDEATIVKDEKERTRFWQGIITDITEERQLQNALTESEALFRSAFDDAATGVVLVGLDGKLRQVNRAFAEMVGYSEEELLAMERIREFTHPDDVERDVAHIRKLKSREVDSYRLTKRFIHRDGRTIWGEMNVSFAYNADNEPAHVVAQVQDVTEQHRLERELRRSEAIFRSAFDNAAIGMARVALDGRWLDVNRSLCRILGYTQEELLAMDLQNVTHPEDLSENMRFVQRVLDGVIPSYTIEKRYFRKGGEVTWVELSVSLVRDDRGEPLFFISQIQDINTKKQLEARLQQMALFDGLTGVLNRNGLSQKLAEPTALPNEMVAVLMLDMDRFKIINDTHGHGAGDQVLCATATRIRGCMQSGDIIARMGGDEFVVILPGIVSHEIAGIVANRIREMVEMPISLFASDVEVSVGVSLGIEIGERCDVATDLIRRADHAMYRDKQGR